MISNLPRQFTYISTESGWNIRDDDGVLLCVVPDSLHEHERDAIRIVRALNSVESRKRISDVEFQPAFGDAYRAGLDGYVRLIVGGWLRLDGLTVRRRADGTRGLYFPEHRGARRNYAHVWPLTQADRAELERVILSLIRVSETLS